MSLGFDEESSQVVVAAHKMGYDTGQRAGIESERERCAKIAESVGYAWEHCGAQIAAVIRSGK